MRILTAKAMMKFPMKRAGRTSFHERLRREREKSTRETTRKRGTRKANTHPRAIIDPACCIVPTLRPGGNEKARHGQRTGESSEGNRPATLLPKALAPSKAVRGSETRLSYIPSEHQRNRKSQARQLRERERETKVSRTHAATQRELQR